MKRFILIIALAIICSVTAMAQDPVASHTSTGRDRHDIFALFIVPDVSYNPFDQSLLVTNIEGNCQFYITNISTEDIIYYNIISEDTEFYLSGFEAGTYRITIVTPFGVPYRWKLDMASGRIITEGMSGISPNSRSNSSIMDWILNTLYEYDY